MPARQRHNPGSVLVCALLAAIALLATGCRASTETTLLVGPEDLGDAGQATIEAAQELPTAVSVPQATPERTAPLDTAARTELEENPFAPGEGGGVDFRLERSDISECDEETLNDYPSTSFLVAHYVVDGNLGGTCFGAPDARLTEAWQVLSAITPPGQLWDLGLFGGFESNENGEVTLAYVNSMDDEGSLYRMSINLDEVGDTNEMMLTMAHEFSHVFTSLSTQIDWWKPVRSCATYHNGDGCYYEDSLMWAWIERFWGNGLIEQIDPFVAPSGAAGQQRCDSDASFLGSYAASSPEEDFAEAFSAYVFRLPVYAPELQAKLDWFAQQPGLAEFQDRAIAAGFGPLDNFFEQCGL